MAASVRRSKGPAPSGTELKASLRSEGLEPRAWGNGPGDRYGWHEHAYHKVLYCVEGAITFHTHQDGDLVLGPGDRLEIPPGTEHAATVGDQGCQCVEAPTVGRYTCGGGQCD